MAEKRQRIEILAPAGSYDCFRAALCAGADAVYAGGPRFGARAFADNFSEEELRNAIQEAHIYGKRLYLTVNTLLKNQEIEELYDYLGPLYECGLDAVIVQDIGALDLIHQSFPEMEIHASTQMTITGALGASFLESLGVSRVVPARELSLSEIRQIRKDTSLEIECFVHGALCFCYSGQCLMSSLNGGRSGNRGQCAQPCRLPYTVSGKKKHYLSLKDICTLEMIPELVQTGIDSFKIEGRMKSPEYVAGVTSMYRKYTDLYLEKGMEGFHICPKDREQLMDLYNRGDSHTGYYSRHNGKEMISFNRPNHAGVPAIRSNGQKGRELQGVALTTLHPQDVIELGKGKENYTLGKTVLPGERIRFLLPKGKQIPKSSVLRRIHNEKLLEELRLRSLETVLRIPIHGCLTLSDGKQGVLTVTCRGCTSTALSEELVQRAQNRPLDRQTIQEKLNKTGGTRFYFEKLEIQMDDAVFLSVGQLNQLRRTAMNRLEECLFGNDCRAPGKRAQADRSLSWRTDGEHIPASPGLSVLTETLEQLEAVVSYLRGRELGQTRLRRVYVDFHIRETFGENGKVRFCPLLNDLRDLDVEVVFSLPYILRLEEGKSLEGTLVKWVSDAPGKILVRNYESICFLKKHGFDKKIILDHNLYVFNHFSRSFWQRQGAAGFTAPLELNHLELEELGLAGGELIVYGSIPVMTTAQCIVGNTEGCKKEPGIRFFTDRYGKRLLVKNHCDTCYNIIYHSETLCLFGQMERVKELSPDFLRLQFIQEKQEEAIKIIALFDQCLQGKAGLEFPEGCTSGHFYKGVR